MSTINEDNIKTEAGHVTYIKREMESEGENGQCEERMHQNRYQQICHENDSLYDPTLCEADTFIKIENDLVETEPQNIKMEIDVCDKDNALMYFSLSEIHQEPQDIEINDIVTDLQIETQIPEEEPFVNKKPPKDAVIKDTDAKLSCNFCQKTFKWKSALVLHENFHTGVRPFTCEICTKSFAIQTHLNRHIKSSHGHKPL